MDALLNYSSNAESNLLKRREVMVFISKHTDPTLLSRSVDLG